MLFKTFVRRRARHGGVPPLASRGSGHAPLLLIDPLERRLLMAAGDLDATFGTGGKFIIPGLNVSQANGKLAIQSDGKLLLPADHTSGSIGITRLNAGGTVDGGYGDGGTATLAFQDSSVAETRDFDLQSNNDAVLAVQLFDFTGDGVAGPRVVRFDSSGVPDSGFGSAGVSGVPTLDTIDATAIDSTGGIVAAGEVDAAPGSVTIVRLSSTAAFDKAFGTGGATTVSLGDQASVHGLLRQPDGKILVLAEVTDSSVLGATRVIRLNANGTVDTKFGTNGVASAPFATFPQYPGDFVLQPNGKIVVRRVNNSDFTSTGSTLVRFNSNGTVDTTFGDQGIVTTPFGAGNGDDGEIAVDSAGDIVTVDTVHVGSGPTDLLVAHFDGATGALDGKFGSGGTVSIDLNGQGGDDSRPAVAVDSAKRVVVFGQTSVGSSTSLGVARLFSDDTPPTASITPPVPVAGTSFTDFEVLFSDDVAVNQGTIDAADVTVTGAQQGALAVTLQSVTPGGGGGASATATYRVTPAGGTWTDASNDTYTVAINAGAVADSSGNTNAAAKATFKVALAPPDTQPPAATLDAATPPVAGSANYLFTVTYTDNVGVGGAGTDDQIQVSGPNGFSQFAHFVGTTGSGTSRTLTYQLAAPGGTWDAADNGAYSVGSTGADAIVDTTGNRVPDGEIGTFVVGVGAGNGPIAQLPSAQPPPVAGSPSYDFTVRYVDTGTVNAATIDGGDIVVTGPNSFSAQASLVSGGLTNGTTVNAVYRITAPGGAFDDADNGTYSVSILANAVANVAGDASPAGSIGSFDVTLGAASVGTLDPTFGNGTGVVSFDPPGPALKTQATIALADGSTVTAAFTNVAPGNADVTLFKTTPAGQLDTTFGGSNGGTVVLDVGGDDRATGIVQLSDGHFVISGTTSTIDGNTGLATSSRFFVARFNADGTVDTSFGTGGFGVSTAEAGVFNSANDLVVLPDGRIIVFGQSTVADPNGDFALARFTAVGVYDTTFGTGGRVTTDLGGADTANAVVLGADGKLVAAGSTTSGNTGSFAAARYNADGSIDKAFGPDGTGFVLVDFRPGVDEANAIVQQSDGKYVLGGLASTGDPNDPTFDSDFALLRLGADGTIDDAFGSGGKVITDFGLLTTISKLAILPGGKIVASGQAVTSLGDLGVGDVQIAIGRFNTDGTLDSTFSSDGKLVIDFEAAENGGTVGASALTDVGPFVLAADNPTTLEQQFAQFRQDAQGLVAVTKGGAILAIATQGTEVELARVIGDAGAPSLFVAVIPAVSEIDVSSVAFVVRYVDDQAVDTSKLGTGDIRVTGPNGYSQLATFDSIVGTDTGPAPEVTVRYLVKPPGAAFVKADEGTYSLAVEPNRIADVNGNTLAAQAIADASFTVTIPENLANLRVDSPLIGKFPAAVVGGAKVAGGASFKLTDSGTVDAKTTVAVTIFASTDQTLDETQDTSIAVINGVKLALKAGKGKTVKLKFAQFPTTLADGSYYLIARVDSGNALPELKKSDNNAVTAAPINIAKAFTDLSGSNPTIKGSLTPGANVSASLLVANAGNTAVKQSVPVAILASPGDQTVGNGDVPVATQTVKLSINPSSSKATKLAFTVPATGFTPGTYTLLAVLDSGATLTAEKDVTNNVVVLGQFTVS